MEHTFKIEKELKITTENIVDCVLSCEAGGFDYWGELCSDEKDYEAARRRLTEREKADMKPGAEGEIRPESAGYRLRRGGQGHLRSAGN